MARDMGIQVVRLRNNGEGGNMQAMLWSPNADGSVSCRLCVHRCRVRKGGKGRCGVRVNLKGGLVSLVNEVVTAVGMDPVEKKPLYHFLPGTKIFFCGQCRVQFSLPFLSEQQHISGARKWCGAWPARYS